MAVEQCSNIGVNNGCQGCSKINVEWWWGGDPGRSDAYPGSVKCDINGQFLTKGVNYTTLPPPVRNSPYSIFPS